MELCIDKHKLRDFSEKIDIDLVIEDLSESYNIENILDDGESLWIISNTLLEDYTLKRINYRGYIFCKMDARILMELRKSMLLLLNTELENELYNKIKKCKTIEDIRNSRISVISKIIEEYKDYDWQVYYLLLNMWGKRGKGIEIDFESCYNDGNPFKERRPKEYIKDFARAHFNLGIS